MQGRGQSVPILPCMQLSTVGYQGRTVEELIDVLRRANVELVLDVRAEAWSRRGAFSRRSLGIALVAAGFAYRHERMFGTRRDPREPFASTGDWEAYARAYRDVLVSQENLLEITRAELEGRRVCLLCLEADASQCHRSLLAEALCEGSGAEPVHL